jgi:hypothetical protein
MVRVQGAFQHGLWATVVTTYYSIFATSVAQVSEVSVDDVTWGPKAAVCR